MRQTLAVLVVYLVALALGQGIPMAPSRPPSPSGEAVPGLPPDEIAYRLHRSCSHFTVTTVLDRPGQNTNQGRNTDTDSSLSSSSSSDESGVRRRTDDHPPAYLGGECFYQGARHKVRLNLNWCFGWNQEEVKFTPEVYGYGLEKGRCHSCRYVAGHGRFPGKLFCTCRTHPRMTVSNHSFGYETGKLSTGV
ncbi:hypothetical protein BDV26DRAFT_297844 [Aspergillus bertholletiae]|uniref:Cyanovirin-N domain-containing protein n=1 Tax=Aspergillus bertholletiae TaxID=1226010 RepID=A0A5N7AT34_9EURO|nr:hypothetical protein BDV26DRAFT_297844 [Aspergillus bertholletiae]